MYSQKTKVSMNKHLATSVLAVVAVFIVVASCGHGDNSRILFVADSLSKASPVEAVQFIDSVTGGFPHFSRSEQMRINLLRAKSQNSAGVVFKSDSVMADVVKYYDKHGTSADRMQAYYILGSVYRDLNDSPLALQYFQKAAEQADTASSDCDYHLLCRIHGQSANLFLEQETPYYALKEIELAERYAIKANDTLSALIYYEQRANAYYLQNLHDSVIAVRERVCSLYMQHGYMEQAALSVGALVHQMLREKEYIQAKKYMDIYDKYVFGNDKKHFAESGRDVYYSCKGLYYLGINQIDSAECFFRKALEMSSSFSNTETACRGLSALYKKLSMSDSLVKYTEMARIANDSSYASKSTDKLLRMKSLYDYNQQQHIAAEEREKANDARLAIVLIVFSFVVILLVFFVFYYRKLLLKERENERITQEWHEMELENRKYRDNIKLLKQTKEELSVLLKKYEGEIEQLIKDKSEAVEMLQRKIDEYNQKQKVEYNKKKSIDMSNSLIVMKFHYLAEKVMTPPSFDDWKDLYLYVLKELPELAEFKEILKNGEYEVCVLVRQGFAPSEIRTLTGRKLSDIANIRKRLLVKIANREGSAKDFDNYMREEF